MTEGEYKVGRGKPPLHTRFKKGQVTNPGGRPKTPPDIAKARRLNQIELDRLINKYLWMDRDTMKARLADPDTPMMEIMIGSIVAKAAQNGDQQRLEFILTRIIGKVKDQLEVTAKPYIIEKLDGSAIVLGSDPGDGTYLPPADRTIESPNGE
jgi:hypothetical protein